MFRYIENREKLIKYVEVTDDTNNTCHRPKNLIEIQKKATHFVHRK